tara:strand:+ start:232 stop:615 length:384 start_codon:yes stop_codon:yes gene_type:complete
MKLKRRREMTGNKKTMITPFIPLTTLREPTVQENLLKIWKEIPICTKLAFISFGIAKSIFLIGIITMFTGMVTLTIIAGFVYFFAVYAAIFLAVRDWSVYYMKEDDKLIRFAYSDTDGTSFLCNKRH